MSELLRSKNENLIKHLEIKVELAEIKREQHDESQDKLSNWYDGYIQAYTEIIKHLRRVYIQAHSESLSEEGSHNE